MHRPSRILAIEPDAERAGTLKALVHEWVEADVVLAASAEGAIAALAEHTPDLILTSALMPPSQAHHLTTHLKKAPNLGVPVLTMPLLVGPTPAAKTGLRSFFSRRTATVRSYSREALGARIRDAFDQSRSLRALSVDAALLSEMSDDEMREDASTGVRVRRARRWMSKDVYWLAGVKLPSGLEVALVNISRSGLLVESGSDLMPGSSTTFQFWGPNRELLVPARIVRSELAKVGAGMVRYQAAAVFQTELDLPTPDQPVRPTPIDLPDLMAQVRASADRGADAAALRGVFEAGLEHLITAREIRIRAIPVVENDGSESIYFTIPTAASTHPILQATFELHQTPSKKDFDILQAAATFAADLFKPQEGRA